MANVLYYEDIQLVDGVKSYFGTSSDLEIYHDGTHSFISDQGAGNLALLTSQLVVNNAADSANMIIATQGGSVNLYYNGTQHFRTISSGAEITGALYITGDGSNAATLTESGSGDFTIDAADDIRLDAGGGDIVLKAGGTEYSRLTFNNPGLHIQATQTNASIYLTPNGTGNVYASTDTLIVTSDEGEAAKFLLRADQGDDNGDDWYITNETSNVLTFKNNISGTSTELFRITPSSSASNSIATFAGGVLIPSGYVGRDSHNRVDFQTDDSIILRVADTYRARFDSTGLNPYADSSYDLGSTSLRYSNIWVDNINGATPAVGANYLPLAGGTMTGNIAMSDNDITGVDKINFTDGIELFGSGNDNYLKFKSLDPNNGGILFQDGDSTTQGYLYYDGGATASIGFLDGSGSWAVKCKEDAEVELRYDNSTKFKTSNTGVSITGGVTLSGTNTFLIESNNTAATFNLSSGVRGFDFVNNNATLLSLAGSDGYATFNSGIQATNTLFSGTMNIAGGIYHIGDTDTFFGFVGGANTWTLSTGGSTRLDVNDAGVRFGGAGARIVTVKDEDDMAANSDVALATQQSIKAYVDNKVTGVLTYQGTWNASTNSPTLSSGSGTPGYYYIVSHAGSTNLDGITDWAVGDWAVFSDQATDAWQKIDNTAVGNVSGTGSDNRLAIWSGQSTIDSTNDFRVDATNLYVPNLYSASGVVAAASMSIGTTSSATLNMLRSSANYINTTNATGYLVFRTAGYNTALTLDTGQNAQFAGTIFASNNSPAYSFSSDTNTGIARTGTYQMGFLNNNSTSLTLAADLSATFAGNVDVRGGGSGYNSIRLVNNTTANNNKQAGITSSNYVGNSVSIMQYATNSGANTVYYGSADGAHSGISNHRFYVNADPNTPSSGHTQALHIGSAGNATFAETVASVGLDVQRNSGSSDDILRITSADIVTTIQRIENTSDANAGYGRLDFKTNAAIGHGNAGRGGFKFINGAGNDILYLDNNDSSATFAGHITAQTDSDVDLGSSGVRFKELWVDSINGGSVVPGSYLPLAGGTMTGAIVFNDNVRAEFGNAGDFDIYHDNTDSFIENNTGNLNIVNYDNDKDIVFKSDDGSGGVETYFYLDGGGGGSQPFTVWPDSAVVVFGTGHDFRFEHNGTLSKIDNFTGDLEITNYTDDGDLSLRCDDGSGSTKTYLKLDGGIASMIGYTDLLLGDSLYLKFGASQDFTIGHNGSNTYLTNATGNLEIINNQDDGDIIFKSDDGSGSNTEYFRVDGGAVKTIVSKNFAFLDSVQIELGDSGDFNMFHNGTDVTLQNFTGDFNIVNKANDKDIIFQSDDGSGGVATYFYLDGSLVNGTSVKGATRFPDASKIYLGTGGDLEIFHNGSQAYIENYTGEMNFTQHVNDGDMQFKCDDGSGGTTEYFSLDGGHVRLNAKVNLRIYDAKKLELGNSGDLQIYHNNSNDRGYIYNGTGDLYIENDATDGDIKFYSDDGSGGTAQYFRVDGGAVETQFLKSTLHYDNVKAKFGDSSDLQIYHDGSNSYIQDTTGTGELIIDTSTFRVRSANGGENMIRAFEDGAVVLSYNQFDKLQTTNTGVSVTGNANFADDGKAIFGTGSDLQIYHDGSDSYVSQVGTGNLIIQNTTDDADIIFKSDDSTGGVTEYFKVDGTNHRVKFSKDSAHMDSVKALFGDSLDLQIFHDSANSYLENKVGNLILRQEADDADILFKCDDGSGGDTTYFQLDGSLGINTFYKNLYLPDDVQLRIGTGSDLKIYHDGSNSYIDETGTGSLYIKSAGAIRLQSDTGENMIYAVNDGAVNLYHNNVNKLQTTSLGVAVTGIVTTSLGTKADPSYTFGGDDNTGMYSDSADSISFTAGGSNILTLNVTSGLAKVFGDLEATGKITSDSVAYAPFSINRGVQNNPFGNNPGNAIKLFNLVGGSSMGSAPSSAGGDTYWVAPGAGRIRSITIRNVKDTPTSGNTRFKIYKNGANLYTSSYITPTSGGSVGQSVQLNDIDHSFANLDRIQIGFQGETSTTNWGSCGLTVVYELSDYSFN